MLVNELLVAAQNINFPLIMSLAHEKLIHNHRPAEQVLQPERVVHTSY